MAKDDEHFRLGVEHGYSDAPPYRWQEPAHQERYDIGYDLGRYQRIAQLQEQYGQRRTAGLLRQGWDDFCERMRRRGWDRDR